MENKTKQDQNPELSSNEITSIKIKTHNQYHSSGLERSDLIENNPIKMFENWFKNAQENPKLVKEPEAVCLSTSTPDGKVSSRFVLLKSFDKNGFIFFTNYQSRKCNSELNLNPRASMAFYWSELHQQIRICGNTERISKAKSIEYFNSRPVGSRIGAWASNQSREIRDRDELLENVRRVEEKFGVEEGSVNRTPESLLKSDLEAKVPLPEFWGGIRLVPDEIEFWVGRPNRLHDRFVYTRKLSDDANHSDWDLKRLSP